MIDEPRHIVLYGSLRAGQPQFTAQGLDKALRLLGPVKVRGRMVDLGDYPGVFVGGDSEIEAELFEILDFSVLASLDAYEDYDPQDVRPYPAPDGGGSMYLRVVIEAGGVPAFIYAYNGAKPAAAVPHGDWLRWLSEREPKF